MLLSFRVDQNLIEETDRAAKLVGLTRSEYLRKTIESENRRIIEMRITYLSRALSNEHLKENQIYDLGIEDKH